MKTKHVPVTERALTQRINRKLGEGGAWGPTRLVGLRGRAAEELGRWVVVPAPNSADVASRSRVERLCPMIRLAPAIAGQTTQLPGSNWVPLSVPAVGARSRRRVLAREHVIDRDARQPCRPKGQFRRHVREVANGGPLDLEGIGERLESAATDAEEPHRLAHVGLLRFSEIAHDATLGANSGSIPSSCIT